MKNIHIITTDKPSRLQLNVNTKMLVLFNNIQSNNESAHLTTQNIYITYDEKLVLGGYHFNSKYGDEPQKTNQRDIDSRKYWEEEDYYITKIILTTDQDLDGVQAIDNEFLEWFIQNPSCEEVEVAKTNKLIDNYADKDEDKWEVKYHIYLPKEEPDYTALLQPVGTRQETLEEAISRIKSENEHYIDEVAFEQGAKWQQEQDRWKTVFEETPPSSIQLLAESPDGVIHLTNWRAGYQIFSCQCKTDSSDDWKWKTI